MQLTLTSESFTIVEAVLYTLSVAYLTHVLLLSNDIGPFRSKKSTVLYTNGTTRPVNLFDRVRRFFGVYKVEGYVWEIKSEIAVWYCPYCLSFWINYLMLLLFYILNFIDTYYFLLFMFSVPYAVGRICESEH